MKLFHWLSESFSQVGWGHIIVMAEDIETARVKAVEWFHVWIKKGESPWAYYFDRDGELDRDMFGEYYDKTYEEFQKDIHKDPLDANTEIFIMGST